MRANIDGNMSYGLMGRKLTSPKKMTMTTAKSQKAKTKRQKGKEDALRMTAKRQRRGRRRKKMAATTKDENAK
jgi:hypothetical protein